MRMEIVHLNSGHDLSEFKCGTDSLDNWLKNEALKLMEAHTCAVVVVVEEGTNKPIAFAATSAATVKRDEPAPAANFKPGKMISVLPAARIGKLAVHKDFQGLGIGKILLADRLKKLAEASLAMGITVFIVDAANESLVDYYSKFGFQKMKNQPSDLKYIPMSLPMKTYLQACEAALE